MPGPAVTIMLPFVLHVVVLVKKYSENEKCCQNAIILSMFAVGLNVACSSCYNH